MIFISRIKGSKVLLLTAVILFSLAIYEFSINRHHIFNPEVTELDVIYGEYRFYSYISGSKGLGERYEFYDTNGKILSVEPGGWRMKWNKEEPFYIGYITGPDNQVVFFRQNGKEILALSDGLAIASSVNSFKKWFLLFDFSLAVSVFIAFIFSGRNK
ncbi:hypothetical protein [Rheinheimera pacifica]|uniref:hypothetical protein n=1 Tax=Rheinheimera pacifica TaxID=173990 RepID=UPI002EDB28F6